MNKIIIGVLLIVGGLALNWFTTANHGDILPWYTIMLGFFMSCFGGWLCGWGLGEIIN